MTILSVTAASTNYYASAPSGPVSVAQALSQLAANPRLKLSISDSTQNIQNNLDLLNQYKNNLTAVAQTDASTHLSMTASEFTKVSGLLHKISTNYQVDISAATSANAASLNSNSHVTGYSVSDSTTNIASQLSALNSTKLTQVGFLDPQNLMKLSATQFAANSSVIDKFSGAIGLSVSAASVSQALSYASDSRVKSVAISDTVSNIDNNLDAINALGVKLNQIKAAGSNQYEVSANQLQSDSLAIGKLYKGYQLTVDSASVAQTSAIASNKNVVALNVVDSASNLSSGMTFLNGLGSKLRQVSFSGVDSTDPTTTQLSLTSAQYYASSATLAKVNTTPAFTFAIQSASVSDAQAFLNNASVTSISVADTGKALSTSLGQLMANTKLSSITETGKSTPLSVNYSDLFDASTNQLTTSAQTFLDQFQNGFSLNVSGVPVGQAAGLLQNLSNIQSISVSGTAADVTAQLPALASMGKTLQNIQLQDPNTPLAITVGQWSKNMGILAKIEGGYSLTLSNVSASNAAKFILDPHVHSVSVSDTSAAIAANLDSLNSMGTQLTALSQTDSNPLSITGQQWANDQTALGLLGSGAQLAVKNASAAQVAGLANDATVISANISDTGANIASNLSTIQAAVTANAAPAITIKQSDKTALSLTAAQLTANSAALSAITSAYTLSVSGVSASAANSVGQNAHVVAMAVVSSAANLATYLPQLNGLGSKLTSITQTDPSNLVNLTSSLWSNNQSALAKVSNGSKFALSLVSATQASSLAQDSRIQSISVSDTAAQISANLDKLQSVGQQLHHIVQSDAGDITVSMSQYTNDANAIAKLGSAATLSITGATAAQALAINDAKVSSVQIADTSANISSNLDALQTLQGSGLLTGISLTGSPQPLSLQKAQLTNDVDALALIQNGFKANISDAAIADVPSLGASSHVAGMVVTLSPADLASDLKLGYLKAANAKVTSIQFATGTSPSPTLNLTAAQWTANQVVFGKMAANFKVALTNVPASSAQSLAQDARVSSLAIADSATGIQNNLVNLENLGPKLASISPTTSGDTLALTLTANQYSAASTIFSAIGQGDGHLALSVTGATADQAQTLSADTNVTSLSVKDSGANIVSHLADLGANTALSQIQLTDPTNTMTLEGSQYGDSTVQNTLGLISGNYSLSVNNGSVDQSTQLQNDGHVSTFTLADSASNVSSNLTSLSNMDKLNGISINQDDAPISITQTQVSSDASILAQLQGPYELNVTDASIADLNNTLQLPNLNSVSVSDSAANVSANFDALVQLGSTVSGITLTDPGTPIALTESQYQQGTDTLSSLQNGYSLAILNASAQDATDLASATHVATVSVADTAANITNNLDALEALASSGSQLDSIAISDARPLVLTQAQQTADQDAINLIQGPFNLITSASA